MDNKDFEKNSIDDILKDFQAKRDSREKSDYIPVNVEPPKPRADFAKTERKQPKPDKEVNKPKIELKKIDFSFLKSDKAKGVYKYLIIIVLIIAVFFAAVFGIGNMIKSSKTSYIKKYQCVSAGLIMHALTKVRDCYALDFHKIKLDIPTTKRILLLGIPAGFQNAVFAIANLFIQAGVNSFDSLMVKGNSAAANADALIYDAMAAFYMACASFMSQNYGAGKLDRVKKSYFIALAYSFGLGAVLGGGLLVFGRQFLALFTTESVVIDAGMKRILVMGWAYCISAFMDCTIAASRGLGRTIGPTVIVILGSCVFRVAWVYTIFAHFHTIPSLYLLYPCSWALTAAAEIAYFVFAWPEWSPSWPACRRGAAAPLPPARNHPRPSAPRWAAASRFPGCSGPAPPAPFHQKLSEPETARGGCFPQAGCRFFRPVILLQNILTR